MAIIRSSNSVTVPQYGLDAMAGSGAPSACFGRTYGSTGYSWIHLLDGTPCCSAHSPAILSDLKLAFVMLHCCRAFLSCPLTHLIDIPAIFISGRFRFFRCSTVAFLNISRSLVAHSSCFLRSSGSGILHLPVSIRNRSRYSTSVHRFLSGRWPLCVAVSKSTVGTLLIGANASRWMIPLMCSGIILIASHTPAVSPVALEYASADGGDGIRPPNLMYATGTPLYSMCPTPPYATLAIFCGVGGWHEPSELRMYFMSSSFASVGIIPSTSSLIGMLYGHCVAASGLGVYSVFVVICIGGCTSSACLSSSFVVSVFFFFFRFLLIMSMAFTAWCLSGRLAMSSLLSCFPIHDPLMALDICAINMCAGFPTGHLCVSVVINGGVALSVICLPFCGVRICAGVSGVCMVLLFCIVLQLAFLGVHGRLSSPLLVSWHWGFGGGGFMFVGLSRWVIICVILWL